MPLDIKIQDDQISDLSDDARRILKKQVDSYVAYLLKETRLIEETLRVDGAGKEITGNYILQAVRRSRSNFKKRKPWHVKICRVLSPISVLFAGILFDRNGFTESLLQLMFFIIFLVIAVITTIFQHSKEDE
jgi:hypothetical protein